jgi:acetyl esterase/lipase
MTAGKFLAAVTVVFLAFSILAFESAAASLPVPTVSSCANPTMPAPNSYVSHLNLTYEIVDGQQEALDLYVPAHVSDPPLIVTVHGGGWSAGDKSDEKGNALIWVGQGYVAASLNYRLVTTGGTNVFPAAVQDVRCAVQWLKSHASAYGYNPNRIGAIGFSAGGHLVGMLGTAAQAHGDLDSPACTETSESPSVNAVASYYGPMDFTDWPTSFSSYAAVSDFLGATPAANPALAAHASPVTYIDSHTPPFFIAQGSIDTTVPPPQAVELDKDLTAAHIPANYFMITGLGHAFSPFDAALETQEEPSNCTLLSFFDAALRHPVEKSRRSRP